MTSAATPSDGPSPIRAAGRFLRDRYAVADLRTLGIYRLVAGFLLFADNIRHWVEAPYFYSNEGMLKNHFVLFRPFSGHNFSVFNAFSSLPEVHVIFALAAIVYFCVFVGFHTRVAGILAFVLVTSLDNRLVLTENGGYVVQNLAAFWCAILPVGRRFSVDAWLRSFRERKERAHGDLTTRFEPPWKVAPYVSIGAALVTLNLAVVYLFNVVNKSGAVWRNGETVHYVLHLDRMITGLAVFFRDILPYWATMGLSWAVLAHEAMLLTLILAPFGRRITRPLAIVGIWLLHTTFGVMMRLGPFSWFMVAWSFVLIQRENWDTLEAFHRRRAGTRVVVYDRSSGLAFFLARVLLRMDGLGLLRFEPSSTEGRVPLLAVSETNGGASVLGPEALKSIARALPLGAPIWLVLRLLSLGLLPRLYTYAEAHREAVARFWGLRSPSETGPLLDSAPPAPSSLASTVERWRGRAGQVFFAYVFVLFTWQTVQENKAIPKEVKTYLAPPWIPAPLHAVMTACIQYPRLFQGWNMFSPNPITEDGSLTVEAWTIDGRHIDPFTGEAPDLDLTDARGLGLNQIWQDYFNRIRLDRNKAYRQGLSEYLQAWHLRTGRPEDELVAFDVYWVRDQCPKPHEDKPYKNETIALLTWRKPRYKPAPGAPAIPPMPKIESAGD